MEKILSVIIPSYNMERYLPQCLDSLIIPSLSKIEVLVVNDGSKDKTLEISKNYEKRFPESIKVIDKPNGNYGSSINATLKVAQGKYLKVLDADDSFETKNLESFIDFLNKTDSDLIISDYVKVNEEGEVTKEFHFAPTPNYQAPFKEITYVLFSPDFQMHAVAYKRSIFDGLNYKQTEGVSYTDMEWMFLPMTKVESVSFFDKVIYRYLVGREGQTVDVSVSTKAVDQTMLVMENMMDIYKLINASISSYHKAYLGRRLEIKAPSIYRISLIKTYNPSLYERLYIFDQKLLQSNPDLHKQMATEDIKGIPFKYVKYWRKKYPQKKSAGILKLVSKLYGVIFK